MKQLNKRVISFLLATCLTLALLPLEVMAGEVHVNQPSKSTVSFYAAFDVGLNVPPEI